MNVSAVQEALVGRRLGRWIECHAVLPSSNDRVRALALEGAEEGTVVVAGTQTAGRGRRGRPWVDRPGAALLFSVLLRPRLPRAHWPVISVAAGVSCARALREVTGVAVGLKWPNDLVACRGGAPGKLGGILLEAGDDHAVLGVGVNVLGVPGGDWSEAWAAPVSLSQVADSEPRTEDLLIALLRCLEEGCESLETEGGAPLAQAWGALDILMGHTVTLSDGGRRVTGVARGISPTGALLVETRRGLREARSGEARITTTAEGAREEY